MNKARHLVALLTGVLAVAAFTVAVASGWSPLVTLYTVASATLTPSLVVGLFGNLKALGEILKNGGDLRKTVLESERIPFEIAKLKEEIARIALDREKTLLELQTLRYEVNARGLAAETEKQTAALQFEELRIRVEKARLELAAAQQSQEVKPSVLVQLASEWSAPTRREIVRGIAFVAICCFAATTWAGVALLGKQFGIYIWPVRATTNKLAERKLGLVEHKTATPQQTDGAKLGAPARVAGEDSAASRQAATSKNASTTASNLQGAYESSRFASTDHRACIKSYAVGFPGGLDALLKSPSAAIRMDLKHLEKLFRDHDNLHAQHRPPSLDTDEDELRWIQISLGWEREQVLLYGHFLLMRTLDAERSDQEMLDDAQVVRKTFGLTVRAVQNWDEYENATYFSPQTLRNLIAIYEYKARAVIFSDDAELQQTKQQFVRESPALYRLFKFTGDPTSYLTPDPSSDLTPR